eukprot:5756092-Amphidinium_carterae.2
MTCASPTKLVYNQSNSGTTVPLWTRDLTHDEKTDEKPNYSDKPLYQSNSESTLPLWTGNFTRGGDLGSSTLSTTPSTSRPSSTSLRARVHPSTTTLLTIHHAKHITTTPMARPSLPFVMQSRRHRQHVPSLAFTTASSQPPLPHHLY